jgi:alpha-tubulin suppressor-like RCC1 family protein
VPYSSQVFLYIFANIQGTGRAMICGGFFHGVFGMNDSNSYATPVDMAPNQEHPRFISGHLGETHTVFITNTGSLYGTGEKFSFGCGDYVTANRATEAMEQKLIELTPQRVTQVACGAQYTCALTGMLFHVLTL